MDQDKDIFFEHYGVRILAALRLITHAVDIHSHKLKSRFNITAPQMSCLSLMAACETMTLSALAARVSLSLSTVNGIVDRLVAKGLITRVRSDADRRKVLLAVTESGREVSRAAPQLLQERLSQALRSLDENEQATIALSLERVARLMAPDRFDNSA